LSGVAYRLITERSPRRAQHFPLAARTVTRQTDKHAAASQAADF